MRLTDLEPQFMRYEKRLGTWTELVRSPLPGEASDHIPRHEVTGMQAVMVHVDTIGEAQGIWFLCPKCFVANKGPVGTHGVCCWSRSRGVPEDAEPKPGRWRLTGTGYHDLSLMEEKGQSRSVLLLGDGVCAWHGFVTAGEVR